MRSRIFMAFLTTGFVWILMLVCPPWKYVSMPDNPVYEPPVFAGYDLITNPPLDKGYMDTVIDLERLAIQYTAVAILVTAIFLIGQDSTTRERTGTKAS